MKKSYKYDLGEYVMTKKYYYEGKIAKRYHTNSLNWYVIEIMYGGFCCGGICITENDII